MRAKWPVFAAIVALGAGYLGYPYATLYQLDLAVRHADAATLRSMVDWHAVREGLKEDICDMVLDEPANARPSNELPPFGAGFVRSMTGNVLNARVTAETLVSLNTAGSTAPGSDAHLAWAFFSSPTEFLVHVRTVESPDPIRVMLELRGMHWQVRRVWLPGSLLERAGSGT